MESRIDESENLYRAIKRSKPDWLDNGKPTSAMYKDCNGNSVDRGDNRKDSDVVAFMEKGTFKNRLKGVVKINAGVCMKEPILAEVKASPTEKNPYHANIFLDRDEQKGTLQALMLADHSVVVYQNNDMKWIHL